MEWKRMTSAFLAGVAIAIGGIAYLSTGYAWLFPVGLFIVCFYKLDLFTGKICYYRSNQSILRYLMIYAVNSVAAYLAGIITACAKPLVVEKTVKIVQVKMIEGWTLIPLAMLCNVCIFVAVDTYKRTKGNPLGLIFATTVFVASGFEHCVANAFYFGVAGQPSLEKLSYLLINMIWNAIGGILACRLLSMTKGATQ